LERKYSLEKYYSELIKMAEERKCSDLDLIKRIREEYINLKNENLNTLSDKLPFYSRSSYQHEADIEKNCEEHI
jgi:predicted DNA-binding ribbon-helix-helix protein